MRLSLTARSVFTKLEFENQYILARRCEVHSNNTYMYCIYSAVYSVVTVMLHTCMEFLAIAYSYTPRVTTSYTICFSALAVDRIQEIVNASFDRTPRDRRPQLQLPHCSGRRGDGLANMKNRRLVSDYPCSAQPTEHHTTHPRETCGEMSPRRATVISCMLWKAYRVGSRMIRRSGGH